jgi:exoribonuclease-2
MFPQELSQGAMSLLKGEDRPTISLMATLDKSGAVLECRFCKSIITVQEQRDYAEVNQGLEREQVFAHMHELSRKLREVRMRQGALNLSLPELQVTIGDARIDMELVPQDSPSRIIIAEFMILYNWLAARFCKKHEIPVLYRNQAPPNELVPLENKEFLHYVFQQRRKLSPLLLDVTAKPHSGLGLDAYVQATSPIRRYLDLLVQRQIKSFLLEGRPLYNEAQLEQLRMDIEPSLKELETAKRNRLRYWILKYLAQEPGKVYRAFVLDEMRTKFRIVFYDFLMIAEIKKQDGLILKSGDDIKVKMNRADPWEDELTLTFP